MPELPEVETIARTLTPQVMGKTIAAVNIIYPRSVQYGQERLPLLAGFTIRRVFRRAKLLLMEVAQEKIQGSTQFLAFHLKMTGRFFVHAPGSEPLKHTRIIFDLEDAGKASGRLFFDDMRTFGFCRLMSPEELKLWPFWKSLGPEPFLTPDSELAMRFSQHRSAIKAVILDQRVVAGVGNIYADESLFKAGILPFARASTIALPRLEALAFELKQVLQQSIEECGSSIRDYRDAKGNAGSFQNNFAVYGRKGQQCIRCGSDLGATRVAGRGTIYCPVCQTE